MRLFYIKNVCQQIIRVTPKVKISGFSVNISAWIPENRSKDICRCRNDTAVCSGR